MKHTEQEFARSKAIVLFFVGTECPVSNGYAPDMQRFASEYAAKGVTCYGLHCDATVNAAEVAKHASEYRLAFPMLLDADQIIAQAVGARVTPEAAVVSSDGRVLYRGQIDDRYSSGGKRRDEPTTFDLKNALDAVLAGNPPAVSETTAFGCPLPRLKGKAP